MSKDRGDSDLREQFTALFRADAELDPGFDEVMRPKRTAGSPARDEPPGWTQRLREAALRALPRRAWAPVFAAAAVLVALWLAPPTDLERRDPAFESLPFDPGRWSLSSDALLDLSGLPGDALLRELPELTAPTVETTDGAHNQQPQHPSRRHTA